MKKLFFFAAFTFLGLLSFAKSGNNLAIKPLVNPSSFIKAFGDIKVDDYIPYTNTTVIAGLPCVNDVIDVTETGVIHVTGNINSNRVHLDFTYTVEGSGVGTSGKTYTYDYVHQYSLNAPNAGGNGAYVQKIENSQITLNVSDGSTITVNETGQFVYNAKGDLKVLKSGFTCQ